jgi:3-oxoacyl-(acyl-carrier-protein) synthase
MAMLAAGKAIEKVGGAVKDTGLNLGSSRGATTLFEKYHKQFIEDRNVSVYSSPTTTLGNISAWTAQYLGLLGPAIDHSITCSTGLHALINGVAWVRAGMARRFICGGTEAALTPFTIAQMKAMRLYSNSQNSRPCESLRFEKKANTMVLGEAAAVVLLEGEGCTHPIAEIKGIGFASEPLNSLSSISADAQSLQRSMTTALQEAGIREVDAVVMHAPGTVKGDLAEKEAIDRVFGSHLPLLTSNKWQVGHTFAASGPLSIEMAVMMIVNNHFVENPFYANRRHLPNTLDTVMVNAVGFGGNAVSIIIGKV